MLESAFKLGQVVSFIIVLLVRLLETLFVLGVIVCAGAVVPVTAYRLFMVLFEPPSEGEDRQPPGR